MSEIEKMYENAEPDRNCNLYKHFTECPMKHTQCEDCENFVYPPFTAEKQIELIKWLAIRLDFGLEYYQNKTWAVQTQLGWDGYEKQYEHKNFDEAISGLINRLWQDLTEAEKAEIKRILE